MLRFLGIVLGFLLLVAAAICGTATALMLVEGETGPTAIGGVVTLLLLAATIRAFRGPRRKSWRADPATDRQKSFADELGVKYHRGITKGELSNLISKVTGK